MATPNIDAENGIGFSLGQILSNLFGPAFQKTSQRATSAAAAAAPQKASQGNKTTLGTNNNTSTPNIDYGWTTPERNEVIYGGGNPGPRNLENQLSSMREENEKVNIPKEKNKAYRKNSIGQISSGYPENPEAVLEELPPVELNPEAQIEDYGPTSAEYDPLSGSFVGLNPFYQDPRLSDNEILYSGREYLPRSQGDEFRDYLKTEEGQKWADTYGYDAYEDLRASLDIDAYLALLGMRDGFTGISPWKMRYSNSGVDFNDQDLAEENFRQWMYDHIIDTGDYMRGNSDISLANSLNDSGNMARWLYNQYNWRFDPDLAGVYNWDEDDAALLAMTLQAQREGLTEANGTYLQDAWDKAMEGNHGKVYHSLEYLPTSAASYGTYYELPEGVAPLELTSNIRANTGPEGEFKTKAQARQAYNEAVAKTISDIENKSGKKKFYMV